ncbi:MAG: Na+/H+ antiporter subunit E [Betaproteobacteria bacterium]
MERAMHDARQTPSGTARAFGLRAAGYYALWIVLIGTQAGDLAAGLLAAAAAAWVSVRLLPPGSLPVRPLALLSMLPRFVWQSVVAGVDVARRVFAPSLPVRPGFVRYRTGLPPGPARAAFTAYTSLMPGTVPCGDEGGAVVYHALDTGQDVLGQLAAEEGRLAPVLGVEAR